MASRRAKWISAAAVTALAAGGYGLYVATAQSTPPNLAQAPLNITNVIPPAFIMAVDDSGSMTFQTLFPGVDGAALWRRDSSSGPGNQYDFFHTTGAWAGQLVGSNPATEGSHYFNVAPYPSPRAGAVSTYPAIPPIDAFGFSRSHVYNKAYFDPGMTYAKWKYADGSDWPDANPTQVPVNPNAPTGVRINMTVEFASTAASLTFQLRQGMVLPAGMKYYQVPGDLALPACGLTSAVSEQATPANWRRLTEQVQVTCAQQEVSIAYFPATFYLPVDYPLPDGYLASARVLAPNACSFRGATGALRCDMYRYEIRPENYASPAAYAAAIQSFANWFAYYGNRTRAMVAAITNSMVDSTRMRVGYFTLNNRVAVTMHDMAVTAQKQQLFDTVYRLPWGGSTFNLSAVDHLGQQFMRTDAGAPVQLACQKNAGMLFTDGFSNRPGPTVGNVDGGMGAPFADSHSNTLADIATRYYLGTSQGGVAPLRSGPGFPAGMVPVPAACDTLPLDSVERKRLDCERDLHMNFYGVTLGMRGATYQPDADRDPYMSPYISWPPYESNKRSTIDDIWHATVNTRGEFINARTPQDITAAMRRILAAVNEGSTPSGTIGQTGARIGEGSLSVTPSYESSNEGTDWSGRLRADKVSVNPATQEAVFTPAWEASAKLAEQGAGARNIRFGQTGASVVPTVRDFTSGNLTLDMLCDTADPLRTAACRPDLIQSLGGSMTLERVVAYLRGDRADEGTLRSRTTLLGDIVNSSPALLSPTDDYGYGSLDGALGTSYRAYLEAKRTQDKRAVLVGANDGMFHVFDGATDANGGRELFAYVPATALGHMGNLVFPYVAADRNDQKFDHRYFVDGPVVVSDVFDGSAWRTIAVGTSGAGGRSVFALDVTDPANPSVLWEVNDRISGNPDIRDNMGYVLGRPVIVPVRAAGGGAPSWKVLFGNGYNSDAQQAALFVVDAVTGATEVIAANEATPPDFNGLGSLVAVDVRRFDGSGTLVQGSDGYADTVYAADQNGAVWKFDLQAGVVDLAGKPLFVARDAGGQRQSILGGLTTALGPRGGVMVYFGTGSFSFAGDTAVQQQQTLYGILDTGTEVAGRGELTAQTAGLAADGRRGTSTNAGNFNSRGWYLDLPEGERFVGSPRIESGVVFFPVYAFAASATADCSAAGGNWLYGLDSISGAAAMSQVRVGTPSGDHAPEGTGAVSLATGGSAPVRDVSVLTAPKPGALPAGASEEEINEALNAQCSMVVRVAGAPPLYLPRPCGRQSWRQVRG